MQSSQVLAIRRPTWLLIPQDIPLTSENISLVLPIPYLSLFTSFSPQIPRMPVNCHGTGLNPVSWLECAVRYTTAPNDLGVSEMQIQYIAISSWVSRYNSLTWISDFVHGFLNQSSCLRVRSFIIVIYLGPGRIISALKYMES